MNPPDVRLTPQDLEKNLSTHTIGKTILVYDQVDSTNDLLKPIMRDPNYNGLAVFARHQRRGKGREGRIWQAAPDSSIICSVLVFIDGSLPQLSGPVALACAVATAQAIADVFALPVKIKWPNDIYLGGKKLSGMLIESTHAAPELSSFVLGVGINVSQQPCDFPPDLRETAVSIAQALDRPVTAAEMLLLARTLLQKIDDNLVHVIDKDFQTLRHSWLEWAGGPDQPVIVSRQGQTFDARIIDIDHHDNSLLVQDPRGLILHLHQNTSRIIG